MFCIFGVLEAIRVQLFMRQASTGLQSLCLRCKDGHQSMPWPNMASVCFRSDAVNDVKSANIIWFTLDLTDDMSLRDFFRRHSELGSQGQDSNSLRGEGVVLLKLKDGVFDVRRVFRLALFCCFNPMIGFLCLWSLWLPSSSSSLLPYLSVFSLVIPATDDDLSSQIKNLANTPFAYLVQ